jgi:putative serine protease PepD
MVDQIRNEVVRVEVTFSNGKSTGTGFFINTDGMVVTARHVVYPPGISEPAKKIIIQLRMPTIESKTINVLASWFDYPSTVIADDTAHDLVVLKPQSNPFPAIHFIASPKGNVDIKPVVSRFDAHRLRDGETVFTSGYPLDLPILITTSGALASSDPMVYEQSSDRRYHVEDIYWADIHNNPGNSGGPLFSRTTAAVIGIVLMYKGAPIDFGDGTQGQANGISKVADPLVVHPLIQNSGIAIILSAKHIIASLEKQVPAIRYEVVKGY